MNLPPACNSETPTQPLCPRKGFTLEFEVGEPARPGRGWARLATSPGRAPRAISEFGFTLVELLVVLVMVTLLVTLLLPALARERPRSQAVICLNNAKQLARGWLMYADDNSDSLPPNRAGTPGPPDPDWVVGDMTQVNQSTNTALIQQGRLWPYVKALDLYKCPANSRSKVRGYSMNGFMGTTTSVDNDPNNFGFYVKLSKVVRPNLRFVTLEEDPNSINDAWFRAQMTHPAIGVGNLRDWPGNSHNSSGGFSFADGHAELHKWKNFGPAPANYNYFKSVPMSPDLLYLMKGSTDSKQGWW